MSDTPSSRVAAGVNLADLPAAGRRRHRPRHSDMVGVRAGCPWSRFVKRRRRNETNAEATGLARSAGDSRRRVWGRRGGRRRHDGGGRGRWRRGEGGRIHPVRLVDGSRRRRHDRLPRCVQRGDRQQHHLHRRGTSSSSSCGSRSTVEIRRRWHSRPSRHRSACSPTRVPWSRWRTWGSTSPRWRRTTPSSGWTWGCVRTATTTGCPGSPTSSRWSSITCRPSRRTGTRCPRPMRTWSPCQSRWWPTGRPRGASDSNRATPPGGRAPTGSRTSWSGSRARRCTPSGSTMRSRSTTRQWCRPSTPSVRSSTEKASCSAGLRTWRASTSRTRPGRCSKIRRAAPC